MTRIATFIPQKILQRLRALRAAWQMKQAGSKDVKNVFREIYMHHRWGKSDDGFFSGLGSLDENTRPYVAYVNQFMHENNITEVVDCGCGDFRVGRQLFLEGRKYVGIDVVDEIIKKNHEIYATKNIEFRELNIIEDDLPDGQLCLIRQVLQHLSNDSIINVISRLRKFRYIIITDAQLKQISKFNIDIKNFGGTRVDFGSSLLLEEEPFNLDLKVVLETPLSHRDDYYLRTVLLTNTHS